jgi:hypothetical protein
MSYTPKDNGNTSVAVILMESLLFCFDTVDLQKCTPLFGIDLTIVVGIDHIKSGT